MTDLARQFDGKVLLTSKMWGHPTGPNPVGTGGAPRQGCGGHGHAEFLVTNRDQLTGGGIARWRGETLFQTPEQIRRA